MPNVVGDDHAEAVAAIKKAVLYYSTTGHHAGTSKWTTRSSSENPTAGTMVP